MKGFEPRSNIIDLYFNVISLAIANRLKKARGKQGDQLHPNEKRWR